MRKFLAVLFVCLLAIPLAAQTRTGNIYGTVVDSDGTPLPGVNVTLTGPMEATMAATTSAIGRFRFLSLFPGNLYQVKAELEGFKTKIEQGVIVNAGVNSDITVVMEIGALEEEVTVVAATPVVTPKRTQITHTATYEMLQSLPSARDPWVVLQMLPSVLMDRENVGGSESGQQSGFVSKGETTDEWVMDGIQITDMSSISSPTYFDFDMFEEISVTTGMTDIEHRERSIVVSFVTKRGGNKFSFGGRFYLTDSFFQASPSGDDYEKVKEVFSVEKGYPEVAGYNSIRDIKDFGFNTARKEIIVANNNRDISESQFKDILLQTIYNVEEAYWHLVYRIENLKVMQQSLTLARDLLAKNTKEAEVGTLAPIEIVSAQAEVASREADILQAEMLVHNGVDTLRTVINLAAEGAAANTRIVPLDATSYEKTEVSLDEALAQAINNRPDLS